MKIRRLIVQFEQCLDDLDCDRDRVAESLLMLRQLEANPRQLLRARRQLKAMLQDIERQVEKAS